MFAGHRIFARPSSLLQRPDKPGGERDESFHPANTKTDNGHVSFKLKLVAFYKAMLFSMMNNARTATEMIRKRERISATLEGRLPLTSRLHASSLARRPIGLDHLDTTPINREPPF